MIRQVDLYVHPNDSVGEEAKGFLEELEVILKVHDLKKSPLGRNQIEGLLRHFKPAHFFNPNYNGLGRKKADSVINNRREVIDLISLDNGYLKTPVVVYGRLMTVGFNRITIKTMLRMNVTSDKKADTITA
nr:hypothetical protein [candidate division Zixibacteria bacterium]